MHWPITRVKVAERSMEPALRPGDWLLVRRTRRIRPGQIVLARHPGRPEMLIVKRAARRVDGAWWLESDNPDAGAVDSRRFGAVPRTLIEGRVLARYWRPRAGANARLHRGGRRLCLTVVFTALPGAIRGDVGAVHAPVGTVAPGVTGAGVDEYALTAGRLADAEPVDAHVGDSHGQAHHRASRVLVRDRTALRVVHVPGLAVVPG